MMMVGWLFLFLVERSSGMYKVDIPLDLKDKAAIERRRREEQQRQGRVFNSKYRQIGVGFLLSVPFFFRHL